MAIKSKLIKGYLKHCIRALKLRKRLARKEAALEPLKRKISIAELEAKAKFSKLKGGQIQEAERLHKELISSYENQPISKEHSAERKKRKASQSENPQ